MATRCCGSLRSEERGAISSIDQATVSASVLSRHSRITAWIKNKRLLTKACTSQAISFVTKQRTKTKEITAYVSTQRRAQGRAISACVGVQLRPRAGARRRSAAHGLPGRLAQVS